MQIVETRLNTDGCNQLEAVNCRF